MIELLEKNKIYTVSDLSQILKTSDYKALKQKIKYRVNKKILYRIKRGIYAISLNYDPRVLANKIVIPSYISLQTALCIYGITFQYSSNITSVSNKNRKYLINNVNFTYNKLADTTLLNRMGITNELGFDMATKERAICDALYFYPNFYFDNLDSINFNLLLKMSKIYSNSRVEKEVLNLVKKYAK